MWIWTWRWVFRERGRYSTHGPLGQNNLKSANKITTHTDWTILTQGFWTSNLSNARHQDGDFARRFRYFQGMYSVGLCYFGLFAIPIGFRDLQTIFQSYRALSRLEIYGRKRLVWKLSWRLQTGSVHVPNWKVASTVWYVESIILDRIS